MAKLEAALSKSCYVAPGVTARSVLYPQPVNLADFSNA